MLKIPYRRPRYTHEAKVSGALYNQVVRYAEILGVMLAEETLLVSPGTDAERDALLDRVFDAVKAAEAEVDAEIRTSS